MWKNKGAKTTFVPDWNLFRPFIRLSSNPPRIVVKRRTFIWLWGNFHNYTVHNFTQLWSWGLVNFASSCEFYSFRPKPEMLDEQFKVKYIHLHFSDIQPWRFKEKFFSRIFQQILIQLASSKEEKMPPMVKHKHKRKKEQNKEFIASIYYNNNHIQASD